VKQEGRIYSRRSGTDPNADIPPRQTDFNHAGVGAAGQIIYVSRAGFFDTAGSILCVAGALFALQRFTS
jgi:hypothetical protein